MVTKLYYDLTDSEWEKVAQNLPKEKSKGRPQINARNAFYRIMWILASGAAWRFLLENKANESKILSIDSTFCKVHQHASGVRKIY